MPRRSTKLQRQARALGDPTRHSIFSYLAKSRDGEGVASLTRRFGLNHNTIRQHLAKLVESGLVIETRAKPQGRGRPRLIYTAAPSRWGETDHYERLAKLLTEVVATGRSATEVGREAARSSVVLPRAVSDSLGIFVDELAREGFAPEIKSSRPGGPGGSQTASVMLRSCPFVSAARVDRPTVCGLHLGIAQGIADAIGHIDIVDLVPTDPRRPRCVVTAEYGGD